MRPLLNFLLCGALGVPAVATAQDLPDPAQLPPTAPAFAPLPEVAPTQPAPEPVASQPALPPVEGKPAPQLASPTTVAPVIVAAEEKDNKTGQKVGTIAVGVVGGLAGAAVAGPVGKFAGGFVGKRLAKGIFGGGKDKIPEVTVANAAPSAESAAKPAVAEPATAPPLSE